MEKRKNIKEEGMWVVRDHDGLYICNRKPFKNYHDEMDFVWSCEGDFIKLKLDRMSYNYFSDVEYEDEPINVSIIPTSEMKLEVCNDK